MISEEEMKRYAQIKLVKAKYGQCYKCINFDKDKLKYGFNCYECKRFFSDLFQLEERIK